MSGPVRVSRPLRFVEILAERNQLAARVNTLVRRHNAQAVTLRRLAVAVPAAFVIGLLIGVAVGWATA